MALEPDSGFFVLPPRAIDLPVDDSNDLGSESRSQPGRIGTAFGRAALQFLATVGYSARQDVAPSALGCARASMEGEREMSVFWADKHVFLTGHTGFKG